MSSENVQLLGSVELPQDIEAREDISAIVRVGSFLVIGSDEGVGPDEKENIIQLLKKTEAEGVVVLEEMDRAYDLIVVCDGIVNEVARRFRVGKSCQT